MYPKCEKEAENLFDKCLSFLLYQKSKKSFFNISLLKENINCTLNVKRKQKIYLINVCHFYFIKNEKNHFLTSVY